MGAAILRSYHDTATPWRGDALDTDPRYLNKRLIGVEVEHEPGGDRVAFLTGIGAVNDSRGPDQQILCETDGSLSSDGIEAILPPLSPLAILGRNSLLRRVVELAAEDTGGEEYGYTNVGMHVNLNVAGASQAGKAAAVAAFHHLRPVTIKVAGRHSETYAQYYLRWNAAAYFKQNKYGAAYLRDNRPVIEVRAHKATVNWDKAKLRVRFSTAVLDFALRNEEQVTGLVNSYTDTLTFARWVPGYPTREQYEEMLRARHRFTPQQIQTNLSNLYSLMPSGGNAELIAAFKAWLAVQRGRSIQCVKDAVL
jgi:hypothetical protein